MALGMVAIPTLETDRLILSAPSRESFPESVAMWSDPVVVKGIGGVPFTREETWNRLLRYMGHWALLGFGSWTVREKTGTFVGEVGFFDLERDVTPKLDIPEVGWVLARTAHGKGYATEAVSAVLAWGERHFAGKPFSCMIDVDNVASHRVAAKTGFKELARTSYKGAAVVLYRR
jgi:RimJ/RimL family protein N-acetyltransferase